MSQAQITELATLLNTTTHEFMKANKMGANQGISAIVQLLAARLAASYGTPAAVESATGAVIEMLRYEIGVMQSAVQS